MIPLRIARRYARALAEYAFARNEQDTVSEELFGLADLFRENPLLRDVFANPIIPRAQKERALETVIERARLSRTVATFLHLLLRNYRLHHLDVIAQAYAEERDRRMGIVTVEVRTARPLQDEERTALCRQLERMTGKIVRLREVVDERVIGGAQVRIGSDVYDGSVASRLDMLKDHLLR